MSPGPWATQYQLPCKHTFLASPPFQLTPFLTSYPTWKPGLPCSWTCSGAGGCSPSPGSAGQENRLTFSKLLLFLQTMTPISPGHTIPFYWPPCPFKCVLIASTLTLLSGLTPASQHPGHFISATCFDPLDNPGFTIILKNYKWL